MLSFDSLTFRYDPYPLGVACPVLDASVYDEMLRTFPAFELFAPIPGVGEKFSLSEKFARANFHEYVESQPVWREFYRYVKSPKLIADVDQALRAHNVDLGFEKRRPPGPIRFKRALHSIRRGRLPRRPLRLRSRFEFSALRATGGCVLPHTDAQKKFITLIISMVRDGEWPASYGGGTDVNRPKEMHRNFNWINEGMEFDEVEVLETIPFRPNQCVVFVKTFNSLHAVRPLNGNGSDALRKSLTINIEEDL